MTELERRALLGDKQVQEECTRQGIVLACPKCYGKVKISGVKHDGNRMEVDFECQNQRCRLKQTFGQWRVVKGVIETVIDNPTPLSQWNTRAAPPIGRCVECKHLDDTGSKPVCWNTGFPLKSVNDFCSYFEPKENEENE